MDGFTFFSFDLKDDKPSLLPIKETNRDMAVITDILCTSDSDFVILELRNRTTDKETEEPTYDDCTIARLYPKKSPQQKVFIPFSIWNTPSFKCSGGDLQLSGFYKNIE